MWESLVHPSRGSPGGDWLAESNCERSISDVTDITGPGSLVRAMP